MYPSFEVLLEQRLFVFFVAAAVGLGISWMAWNQGYYRLPPQTDAFRGPAWKHVLGAFALFLAMEMIVVPSLYLFWLFFKQGGESIPSAIHLDEETQGWVNFLAMVATWAVLMAYFFQMEKGLRQRIWGHKESSFKTLFNLAIGAITWLVVYPWILVLGQVIGIIEQFHYEGPHIDQVAVKHLKDAFAHPLLLWLTVIAVVTIVPCLEELLFRGFLQTWLKSLYGRGAAITLTSAIFAAFHYSASQGIENIELLFSLFLLSCYLGFIRERQDSLWASIGLHATFNSISLLMIFAGE